MNAPTTPLFAAGLTIHSLGLGPIGTNCYVLHRPDSERAVVVDPGAEAPRVLALLEQHGLTVDTILLTHSHWDHVGAVADLAEATAAPVWISAIESIVLADLASYAPAAYGPWRSWSADRELVDGDAFTLAGIDFEALVLPGHSPGSIGFLVTGADPADPDDVDPHDSAGTPLLVIGDVIFRDSVGRTDLPFGDTAELMASCRRVLETCSDDTLLVPGHGPETTVGREREHNPYLRQALAGA